MSVTDKFKDKRVLIWGYGREGRSSEEFLKKYCSTKCTDIFEGKKEDIKEEDYDYIIKSPGIVMEEDEPGYTSQTQIFLEEFRQNTIGITGTKGKSTTSAMLYHVLKESMDAVLVGNIGKPCLDYFGEIKKDTAVVFEMSAHQLAHLDVSPHIAIFLSFFEEHLDYYKTVENYFNAKAHVTTNQLPEDFFLTGVDVPDIETKAKKIMISRDGIKDFGLKVLGAHNDYNAQFVCTAAALLGVEESESKRRLQSFEGLDHRLQYVGSKRDIFFYDDSISTIPDATIEALCAVENAQTVIVGGMDRGIDYDVLIRFINGHEDYNYIFCYESGRRIYEAVSDKKYCFYRDDLKAAFDCAVEITDKGMACILSPASASYGYFKNFEERGDVFKEYIDEL